MSKVLDLSCFMQETISIKMLDGSKVDLPKPTQRFAIFLTNYYTNKNTDNIVEMSNQLTTAILNTNIQGRKFTEQEVSELPLTAQVAIIKEYREFCVRLTNNPN